MPKKLYSSPSPFGSLTEKKPTVKKFIGERKVEYNLICDYGNGGIAIFSEIDDVQKWY
jgi:hypothetical protein